MNLFVILKSSRSYIKYFKLPLKPYNEGMARVNKATITTLLLPIISDIKPPMIPPFKEYSIL